MLHIRVAKAKEATFEITERIVTEVGEFEEDHSLLSVIQNCARDNNLAWFFYPSHYFF